MARRRHPFYKPVSHRVADSARRDISNLFYDLLSKGVWLIVVWIGIFAMMIFLQSDAPTFQEYLDGTMDVLVPIFKLIGQIISGLFQAVSESSQ